MGQKIDNGELLKCAMGSKNYPPSLSFLDEQGTKTRLCFCTHILLRNAISSLTDFIDCNTNANAIGLKTVQ